ncbi:MAG: hypothetical protein AB7K09_16960 [Planctomycetota bacterium]
MFGLSMLPGLMFVQLALAKVEASHALLSESWDYVVLCLSWSGLPALFIVVPGVIIATSRANRTRANATLAILSLVVFGCSNFMALAMYSLRIT